MNTHRAYADSASVITCWARNAAGPVDLSAAVLKAGGHSNWLRQNLAGNVLHDIEYFDTSPMAQFAVGKETVSSASYSNLPASPSVTDNRQTIDKP